MKDLFGTYIQKAIKVPFSYIMQNSYMFCSDKKAHPYSSPTSPPISSPTTKVINVFHIHRLYWVYSW